MFTVEISHNAKVGPVSATYAPRQTCSHKCPFKNNGCYSEGGNCRIHFNRISADKILDTLTPRKLAELEAQEIIELPGILPLRLHVTGDARTPTAARTLSYACRIYRQKHNQPVWTYTHSWRDVPRDAWGLSISVLASCETPAECALAHSKGYAPALIVMDFREDREVLEQEHGLEGVVCPHIDREKPCVLCKLCFDDFELHQAGKVVMLPPHGSQVKKIYRVLEKKRAIR